MQAVYVALSDAPRLLEKRCWLRSRVEQWWREMGWRIPKPCPAFNGVLVFGKAAVATCRYEDILFTHRARELGLRPVWMEHTEGHLSTHSPFKRSLLHPTFAIKRGRNGGLVLKKEKLGSLQDRRMQQINTIRLDDGTPLIDYHHRLHARLGLGPESVIEASDLHSQFATPRQYYLPYLSLFLAHAVLVDDFHGGEDSHVAGEFTDTVFLPAYRELSRRFGVSPLIARLPWHEHLQYFPLEEEKKAVSLEEVFPQELWLDVDDVQTITPPVCRAA